MKRPAVLIIGAVAGALLVAGVGASAHTGLFVTKSAGIQSGVAGDEASAPRVEPTETPEAQATEPPEAADIDEDTDEDNDSQTNDDDQGAAAAGSGEHESGSASGGGGEHGD